MRGGIHVLTESPEPPSSLPCQDTRSELKYPNETTPTTKRGESPGRWTRCWKMGTLQEIGFSVEQVGGRTCTIQTLSIPHQVETPQQTN